MGLDFNESDILKDILNFKIVNRKKLEEKYGFKIIDRMIKHINEFLCKNDNGIIHKSKNYLYYFGKYYESLFKINDRDINMRMSFRRELITLILLLGKEKLNIYKFNKQIRRNEQNTKNIQNDLKQILKTYNIKHLEYIRTANIEKLFKNKNYDLKELRENYLREILMRRMEKIYIGKSTYQENFYFKILQEILEIKNIKYIKRLLFLYIDQFTDIISMYEKYSILTYFILNMKSTDIKFKYRLKKTDENKEFFIMMDKISKREKLKIDCKFMTLFYKKLHRKKRKPEKILSEINKAIMIEKNQETFGIKKVETRKGKEEGVEVYSIAETSVNFENKDLLNKKLLKKYIHLDETVKIRTLVLVDVEENQILKSFNKVMKFFNFLEVVKVEHLNNFKKVITKNNTGYEQVLIISNSKFLNTIRNFSDIPIFNFVLGKEKGTLQSRINILKQMIYLRRMMFQYLEFKKDRKIIHK
ncbi:hypothetical protein HW276_01840 [Leptotrichia sp. oral taxon 417]|jgi:hypothetical protein|uniref:hypothetical protein n=1 Tax=Leptotrichia sp. oral taxon 417 TaxID=712365 RepID=UPI0015BF40ED|nr:hypothetical protein [Leptotrichia sp. oral taxon 417]NWO26478.1 hypothetical protein [Leptotrichia sp. oral taxon 417]